MVFYEGLRLWGVHFYKFYEGLRLWYARFVVFYEGLGLWEARLVVFYGGMSSGRLICSCFTCRGGSRGFGCLTTLRGLMKPGGSAKERSSRAWDHMSSNDVGSYELKRTPCEMQMEECSATLARSTSDGSADYYYYY